ncbi:class V aminotransferase [Kitasatospora phosalacinea]|uniref:Class V aminotransferase n=1 Tax=Kitasatospora phosalacinea TaxID=2065 RepID=A0A9W6V373_9ACTN|nr:alanine--glyoxylate aminotransferase family protein [Kitasatospora phosalacinea]GLW70775.1 class V aminotransferase [Kitasatospora phosalacinea]
MPELSLFTPGPTHVPLDIRIASISRLAHHRAPEFQKLFARIQDGLRGLFRTTGTILVLPASGTGAMEAVVHNTVSPGDRVLVLAAGKYGRRWAELSRARGAEVRVHEAPDGASFDPAAVERELAAHRPRHLLLTHCETSTATVHDVEVLAGLGRRYGATVVADTMTSIGVEPFHMDAWGVDFAVTASHKGLMSQPGAAFVAVGERGWEAVRTDQGYSYWSFPLLREAARDLTVPNTPPVAALFAVAAGLDRIEAEKLENVWTRHARTAEVCRAALAALGLPLFTTGRPSAALTAVSLPADGRGAGLTEELYERFGLRVAGGQGALKGRILRVGHIGAVTALDLLPVLTALELLLLERGLAAEPGRAATAAAARLWQHHELDRRG